MRLDRIKGLAQKASELSDHHSHKIGAVIFSGKAVLAERCNWLFKTHPEYSVKETFLKPLHAEAAAIMSCRHQDRLKGSTIFVYRSTADGQMANAKPCEDCAKMIKKYGIRRVIYTNSDKGITIERV